MSIPATPSSAATFSTNNNPNNSVLDYLSFQVEEDDIFSAMTPSMNTMDSTPSFRPMASMRMQGVLWKRRDVFRNRWRPRWFVLQPDQHILTYYLLNNEGSSSFQSQPTPQPTLNGGGNRRRTFSESSNVSENTVDYDVVPRGTIYLLGATAEINDVLTRPDEELYVISISDPEHKTQVHLAARTSEARAQWMRHIRHVASRHPHPQQQVPATAPPQQRPPRRRGAPSTARNLDQTSAYATPPRANGVAAARSNNNTAATTSPSTPPMQNQGLVQTQSMRSAEHTTTKEWKILQTDKLFQNVPIELKEQIEEIIHEHLPYVEEDPANPHHEWKPSTLEHGSLYSSHRSKPMIRSIRQGIPNHHPVEYLQLVWDLDSAKNYENNVRTQRLLQAYNPNTSLVYKAYQAVWPTSPRDFGTAAFWTLLERNGGERAICVVAFSCDQAEEAMEEEEQDPSSSLTPHVRGTLKIALNFWTLKPEGCYHARIISFQLNGKIPVKMSQTILEQQANMPRIMDAYLTKLKERNRPTPHPEFKMEYDAIYDVLKSQPRDQAATATTTTNFTNAIDNQQLKREQSVLASSKSILHVLSEPLTLEKEAMVLLAPLLLYKILSMISIRLASVGFVVASVFAVKWVVGRNLLTVLRVLPRSEPEHGSPLVDSVKGSTTCRFTIDLKGVLRFLENEKEAQSDISNAAAAGPEILVSHILVRSVAKAMSELPHLVARGYPFFPPLYAVDVVFHDHVTGKATWVNKADEMTVQDIAEYFTTDHPMPKSFWQQLVGATCHIVTSPDSDHAQVDLDLSLDGVPVCMVVSGIRLEKEHRQPSLSVAITIRSTNIEECREFAETVQKSIQFPEMLD